MVSRGQFLERATLVPVAGVVMEGVSHRGPLRPLLLVLPPTPTEGGSMDTVVGAELAWAATHAGFPTLRFNYRGVGGSQGKKSAGPALLEDARAALEVARDNAGGGPVAVAALGGSALVALALAEAEPGAVAGLVLVSPAQVTCSDLARLALPLAVVVGALDTRLSRPALAEAVAVAGGVLEVVPGADATFTRNLPETGKATARFLGRIRQTA